MRTGGKQKTPKVSAANSGNHPKGGEDAGGRAFDGNGVGIVRWGAGALWREWSCVSRMTEIV